MKYPMAMTHISMRITKSTNATAISAIDAQGIAGWPVSPTSTRAVYNDLGKSSIYAAGNRQGAGIGSQLLVKLILASKQAKYWILVAQLFPENKASLAQHWALGFCIVGVRTRLGLLRLVLARAVGATWSCWNAVVRLLGKYCHKHYLFCAPHSALGQVVGCLRSGRSFANAGQCQPINACDDDKQCNDLIGFDCVAKEKNCQHHCQGWPWGGDRAGK